MSYSFYEVYTIALRACGSMGFPYGADEDAAFMIAWLELNNLQGIRLFARSIDDFNNKYDGKIVFNNKGNDFNLKNTSVLMKGPGIIDYYESLLKNQNIIEATISNCIDPIFFLPLLYKTSPKICFSRMIHFNSDMKMISYQIKNKIIQIGLSSSEFTIEKNQVKIILSNQENFHSSKICDQEISPESIQHNLENALKPRTVDWEKIKILAQRTYVPESEESRVKGAGGGDDND